MEVLHAHCAGLDVHKDAVRLVPLLEQRTRAAVGACLPERAWPCVS
jgi:hypothetical protein